MNKKDFQLDGKNILLIGATGTLGRTFAKALKDEGANLALLDHPDSNIIEFAENLSCYGHTIDLAEEGSVKDAISNVGKEFGTFHGLINNAAATTEYLKEKGNVFKPFEDYSLDVWKHSLDIDLTGTFLTCRESARYLSKEESTIVNISSIYGINAPDHRIYKDQEFQSLPSYSASKAGVIGLSKWLSTWWATDNIRVNCITPGGVFNDHNDLFVKEYSNRTPLGRMANREELVGILLFLMSDLSSYCTGQNFVIDGGLSAW